MRLHSHAQRSHHAAPRANRNRSFTFSNAVQGDPRHPGSLCGDRGAQAKGLAVAANLRAIYAATTLEAATIALDGDGAAF